MAKTSGGIRGGSAKSSRRTGPGFTEPIQGPTKASSNATEIQYVFVDKITGNESNGYISSDVAKKAIKQAERRDKDAGIYEPDNYYIQRIEVMKGTNRSSKYRGW